MLLYVFACVCRGLYVFLCVCRCVRDCTVEYASACGLVFVCLHVFVGMRLCVLSVLSVIVFACT